MAQEPISHTFSNGDNPASINVHSHVKGNVDSEAWLNGKFEVSKERQSSYLPASPSSTVQTGEAARTVWIQTTFTLSGPAWSLKALSAVYTARRALQLEYDRKLKSLPEVFCVIPMHSADQISQQEHRSCCEAQLVTHCETLCIFSSLQHSPTIIYCSFSLIM